MNGHHVQLMSLPCGVRNLSRTLNELHVNFCTTRTRVVRVGSAHDEHLFSLAFNVYCHFQLNSPHAAMVGWLISSSTFSP